MNLNLSNPAAAKAASLIISHQTIPPQIDYISPADRAKAAKAEDFINSLPTIEANHWNDFIADQVDKYYMSGVAELDAMF